MSLKLTTRIMELESEPKWDDLIKSGAGGTIFHESWYLKLMGVNHVLGVYSGNDLIAGMPLYGSIEKGIIYQSTISVPYSGPVFDGAFSNGRHAMLIKRRILEEMILTLKTEFSAISFAASFEITDIVPYLRNGFIPEVRYTYINHLVNGAGFALSLISSGRRKDIKIAQSKGIKVYADDNLKQFDIAGALFWSNCNNDQEKVKKVVGEAARINRGKAFVALDRTDKTIGGLFLVWDPKRSYTIYSYFDRSEPSNGIPTVLYIEAMHYTKEVLNLDFMDFEGSVLPGVEEYYQSFGAVQTLYFNLHWSINQAELLKTNFYNYE